jgi:hypothetical protein
MSRTPFCAALACWMICVLLFVGYCRRALATPNCDTVCRETDCIWIGGGENLCRAFEFSTCAWCVTAYCPDTKLPGSGTCTNQNYYNWFSTSASCVGTCPPPQGLSSHDADLCAAITFDTPSGIVTKCQ